MDNNSSNNSNLIKSKIKPKLELHNRQCWICLQNEFKDEINPISGKPDLVDPNEKWLTPCRCKGSTQYVHEECLINWIKLKRDMDQKNKLCCPSCQTPYTILIPKKTLFQQFCIYVVDKTEYLLQYIPLIVKYICIGYCIWEFSYIYGKLTLTSMFENEFQDEKLSKNLILQEFLFRCFPVTLISMLFIPWEFSFLISAAIMHFTSNKEIMITMILLYAYSCDFFSSAIRLVLDYIFTLKLNLGLRNDEKTKEQRRLKKLSKSVSFPNARVHINENFISPSSFTLKIHILEETQNPIQANPQVLYVEYEKAIILLAVLKSKILHLLLNNRNANFRRQQNEANNENNENNANNNNNNNNIVNNNDANDMNNNNINININNLNTNLSISTVNLNVNSNYNNIHSANEFNRRFNNFNEENKHIRQHKKCQSLPPYLRRDFLKNRGYANDGNNDFNKIVPNKSISINNMFDSNNYSSFQYLLKSPRNKKYSEKIDNNIDDKLKNSLKNILSNKENNFMKILNKQKSLYTKLTASSNTSLNKTNSLSPTKDKKMKSKALDSSNESLNKPLSSYVDELSSKEITNSLPSPSKTNRKSILYSPLEQIDSQELFITNIKNVNNKININDNSNGNNDSFNMNGNNNQSGTSNNVKNSLFNNVQNNIQNNAQNNTQNNPQNNPQNNAQTNAQTNSQNNPQNNAQNNPQNNAQNNAQNNPQNYQNLNNRRNKEAYLTINITNVSSHVKNLIIKTLSLPVIALIIGRLIHWSVLIIQLLLKNFHLYQDVENIDILNEFKTNPLIYTAFGIIITSSFSDICHLYYHYSKNIEKQKLVVLNHQDISKKLNNYTSIN